MVQSKPQVAALTPTCPFTTVSENNVMSPNSELMIALGLEDEMTPCLRKESMADTDAKIAKRKSVSKAMCYIQGDPEPE